MLNNIKISSLSIKKKHPVIKILSCHSICPSTLSLFKEYLVLAVALLSGTTAWEAEIPQHHGAPYLPYT